MGFVITLLKGQLYLCSVYVNVGLDVVGIYRLSGQSTSIQKYKNLYNTSRCPYVILTQKVYSPVA